MSTPHVAIVAAIGRNRELGKNNELLWHIPDDLKRFKELTLEKPIIMGRKTFESILGYLGKPFPKRTNIVVTRDGAYQAPEGVIVVHSLEEALEEAKKLNPDEIHIGGGTQLYEQSLPYVDRLYITHIDDAAEADTFFPEFEKEFTKKLAHEERVHNGIKYQWVDYERITP